MSHRTKELPRLSGFSRIVRELRYHELSRQLGAVLLILLFALVARPTLPLAVVGLPLAALGMAVRLYASGFIVKNRELARHGPYALVRHPLYTGNILILLGFSIASGVWWCLAVALAFFWFYYPAAIEYEDRKLRRIFESHWDEWAESVPALWPAFGNVANMRGGSWSLAKCMRGNGEGFIALYILACMTVVVFRLA